MYQDEEDKRDPSEILHHAEKINEIIASKWGLLILRELHFRNRAMRFNELLNTLEPIGSRNLSLQLKKLLKWSMIEKNVLSTSPQSVEYSLTVKGREFTSIFQYLSKWSFKWNY